MTWQRVLSPLHRLRVESSDPDSYTWRYHGQVLLPDRAVWPAVVHALAAVGIYAPRGGDVLSWESHLVGEPFAVIYDATGYPIVRITKSSQDERTIRYRKDDTEWQVGSDGDLWHVWRIRGGKREKLMTARGAIRQFRSRAKAQQAADDANSVRRIHENPSLLGRRAR